MYTSNGDGLDSNGSFTMHNGDLEVFSQPNADNSPLDSDGRIGLMNGVALGVGSGGMAQVPSAGVYVEFRNVSVRNGNTITIKGASGNELKNTVAYWSVSSAANYMIFSHPALVSGSTYRLYINGSQAATGTASGAAVDDTPWTDIANDGTEVFEQVTHMDIGPRYVITNASLSSPVNTLAGGTAVSNVSSTLTSVAGGYTFGTLGESNTWHMGASGHIYCTASGANYYLNYTTSSSGWNTTYALGITTDETAAVFSVTESGSGAAITTTASGGGFPGGPGGGGRTLYLNCSGGTWRLSTASYGSGSYVCYLYAPAEAQTLAWSDPHISYGWEPAFNNAENGEYVLTVCYGGIAIGAVTVVIVGEDETLTVTFMGDYVATMEVPYSSTVTLPTAPVGYVYRFYLNGLEFDPDTVITMSITINVVLEETEPDTGDFLSGDVDGNCVINTADALLAMRHAMGVLQLTGDALLAADYNGDGTVNSSDALLIMRIALGN